MGWEDGSGGGKEEEMNNCQGEGGLKKQMGEKEGEMHLKSQHALYATREEIGQKQTLG